MTIYLVISLPKIPYTHRVHMVLASPKSKQTRGAALLTYIQIVQPVTVEAGRFNPFVTRRNGIIPIKEQPCFFITDKAWERARKLRILLSLTHTACWSSMCARGGSLCLHSCGPPWICVPHVSVLNMNICKVGQNRMYIYTVYIYTPYTWSSPCKDYCIYTVLYI
jgi:hypothetical protein